MVHQGITHALLQASSLNAKRQPSRSGVDSWYPYYAGFSDVFVENVLKCIPLRADATVLDPWNGSGTTTRAADRMGLRAIGFDINPVANLVASAKLARAADAQCVIGLADRITRSTTKRGPAREDPLNEWLPARFVAEYRAIERSVLADLATGRSRKPLSPLNGFLPPLAAFLILALMRAARVAARVRTTTNPTWIAPGKVRRFASGTLGEQWLTMVELMADELSVGSTTPVTRSETRLGDARCLSLRDGAVDVVVTSPPYCTRLDYTVSTSFELAALGLGRQSQEYDALRRAMMGTPLARRGAALPPSSHWPDALQSLLRAIKSHPSKASGSYYYKTYWQYFRDAELALRELHRTLRVGGAAVLVLQSSYYKEVRVDLPRL
jgi:hypothetical protein